MRPVWGLFLFFILCLGSAFTALAQQSIVFVSDGSHSSLPINLVDSITIPAPRLFDVHLQGTDSPLTVTADTAQFFGSLSDTLVVEFQEQNVKVQNPHLDYLRVQTCGADAIVTACGQTPFVCVAKGTCNNGRLIIDADTTCTLLLSDLHLSSCEGSAIYLKQKQKAEIVLVDGTENCLSDAAAYHLADSTDTSNACIYSRGSLTLAGAGTLNIYGNYRHGIFSSKNITVEDGCINILDTQKDGIHCDKYKQKGGTVHLHLAQPATKGIKAKKELELKGGHIEGEATGDLTIKDGETSYCSFLKSDGTFTMSGGSVSLQHQGSGGRCISVDSTMMITGGSLDLECLGDGGQYLTAANDTDYYTPKCITADDSVFIKGGHLTCLSTGLGGKGIVAGTYLAIGGEAEPDDSEPFIRVETQGECIINNTDEDLRFGCPKGIKADSTLIICGGNIAVHTSSMGGEGVECNGDMFIHGGTLECITFDDGINVGHSIEIAGGQVYCNSADNDGIDSNGSITISGGIVASVNQLKPNESFDAENGQIYFKGGTVFGIGSAPVYIHQSDVPYYSTPYNTSDEGPQSIGLILTDGKYISVQKGDEVLISLRNDNRAFRSFITIMSPSFSERDRLSIVESEQPVSPQQSFFNDKLLMGGTLLNPYQITEIHVQTIQ